jgi:phosphate uptake regulator
VSRRPRCQRGAARAVAGHGVQAEQQRVERLLTTELAKDAKTNVEVVQQLTITFLAQNKATVLDPLGLADKIESLSKAIEDFETQVDYSLSESNGRTTITA